MSDNKYPQFRKSNWRKNFLLYLVILGFILSFGAGLAVGESRTRSAYLTQSDTNEVQKGVDLGIVFEAWKKLSDKYVGSIPDNKSMVYGMAKGMTQQLDDPYTVFFEPDKAKQFKEDLKGSFEGIGAEIGLKDNLITIIAPIKDTPADKAGLKPGDKVLKIDVKDTSGLSVDEAVAMIRGKKGTQVKLNVISENDSAPRDVTITRDVINVKSVEWKMKDGQVAYLRLSSFSEDTVKEFTEAARQIRESDAKSIVLDLRGNPGGYLDSAVDVASFFLPKGTQVVREDFGGKQPANEYLTQYAPTLDKYPLVALVDKGSASAAEILAGALSEKKGVKLIGEKTYGKGSVQEFITLSDGSTVKITVAEWLTPEGKNINKEGISPDVEAGISAEDLKNKQDPQLDKALETVKNQ